MTDVGIGGMDAQLGPMKLSKCTIDIIYERYTRRDYKEGREGDDIRDLGRKSYEFHVRGKMKWKTFEKLNDLIRSKKIKFEFALGKYVVVCKRMEYNSSGEYYLHLIEDVQPYDDSLEWDQS